MISDTPWKSIQTTNEKELYINFHDRGVFGVNDIYELETNTRQELLVLMDPYATAIIARMVDPNEFNILHEKFPRWVENIFTRNSIESNMEYFEYMTLAYSWSMNDWNNQGFNLFCDKLYRELGQLVLACGFVLIELIDFKSVVRAVSRGRHVKISQMGYVFGGTEDDDGSSAL